MIHILTPNKIASDWLCVLLIPYGSLGSMLMRAWVGDVGGWR